MSDEDIAVNDFVVKRGTTSPIGIVSDVSLSLVISVKWGEIDGEPQYEDVLIEDLVVIPKDTTSEDEPDEKPIRHNIFEQNE